MEYGTVVQLAIGFVIFVAGYFVGRHVQRRRAEGLNAGQIARDAADRLRK